MNRERILDAIEIMKQAKEHQSLFMPKWQVKRDAEFWVRNESAETSLDKLHACGNKACFAGHLAISPMWKESGFSSGKYGNPVAPIDSDYFVEITSDIVALYLGISKRLANSLVFGDLKDMSPYSNFYKTNWREVTPDMVIEKLELILSGELS